jgi:DNA-binding transcriptional ArsR family regulator
VTSAAPHVEALISVQCYKLSRRHSQQRPQAAQIAALMRSLAHGDVIIVKTPSGPGLKNRANELFQEVCVFGPISNSPARHDFTARHPGSDGDRRSTPDRMTPMPAAPPADASSGSGSLDKDVDATALSRLLALLADKTRLRILWLLAEGERAVGAMTSELGLPQPTVSHHLAWLRTMHLVSPRRAGKNVFYALGRAARTEPDGTLSLLTADTVVSIGRRPAE